jgi:uncharacterized DUF497 family protein
MIKNIIIRELIVEEDRPAHIARHSITLSEVLEVLDGDFVFQSGKFDRWLLTGTTSAGRFLTIVLGQRAEEHVYGLVTARPARTNEKERYAENILEKGGEEDDTDKESA